MQLPPLTHSIGLAERAMRALLEQKLQEVELSFPAWTTLVFTSTSPLSFEQVEQRQISGHIVSRAADVRLAIDMLIERGMLIANESGMLMHTEKGSTLFKELSGKVKEITQALYGDLPGADLEATHRTLLEIAKRANSL